MEAAEEAPSLDGDRDRDRHREAQSVIGSAATKTGNEKEAGGKDGVRIILRPAGGNTHRLAQQKFMLDGSKTVLDVQVFLTKKMAAAAGQGQGGSSSSSSSSSASSGLYLYCGSGFAPTPDHSIADLFRDFRTGNELHILYGSQEAWG